MAYMNQEKKKEIAKLLKDTIPKTWKYSLSVKNHSTIVLTIAQAPVALLAGVAAERQERNERELNQGMLIREVDKKPLTYASVHQNHRVRYFTGELLETFNKIFAALNLNNHDNSDAMTDYFDVGHYVDLNIGTWEKPFVLKA